VMLLGAVVIFTAADRARPAGTAPVARSPAGGAPEPVATPEVTGVTVAGHEVDLVWTWSDRRPWDVVRFHVTVSAWDPVAGLFVGEETVSEEGLENAASYRAESLVRGTLFYEVPAPGLYAFRVEVLAKDRPAYGPGRASGHDTLHRAWTREKVLVGSDGWAVVPLPGIRGDLRHDARDERFSFFYELYRGPSLVRDCELDYLVGWPADVLGHDCDWDTGERALVLANPRPGTAGVWRLTFARDEDGPLFGDLDLESDYRNDGVYDDLTVRAY
jgi:hypothetical protein